MIYLDSAAKTKPLPCAIEAFLNAPFGNPSSEHAVGQTARDALEQAREKIARLINCKTSEIVFTATATEAAALVANSLYYNDCQCIVSPYEHHAISENIRAVPFNRTVRNYAVIQQHSNNETGEILNYPSDKLMPGNWFVCDATSSVGHVPLSFVGMSHMIFDAIKLGSVPSAAALVVREDAPLYPLIRGGGQERGMRSGTENVPAICAMAAALEWQMDHMEENTQHIGTLRAIMFKMLSEIPNHKWNTPFDKPCVPHILNISFDGVDAHALALLLSKEGIMVSPGAACSNGLHEPSHVILAMFGDEERARSAIRISFSHENTADEIVEAGQKIKEAVSYLRSLN